MSGIDEIAARHVRVEGKTMEPDFEHPEPLKRMRVAAWCGAAECEFATWPCDTSVVLDQLAQSAEALRAVNAAHQIEVSYHYERMDCSCGWQAGIRDYSQPEGDQWIERDWQNDHFLPLLLATPDSTGAREP